jgi:hypothetical protein
VRAVALTFGLLCFVASAPSASIARAEDMRPRRERIDYTAHTLRGNEALLGIGMAAYGVLDELTVGTYLPTWLAWPVLGAPIATGFVKARDWLHGPLAVSLRGTFAYANVGDLSNALSDEQSTRAQLWVVPLELSGSLRVSPAFNQSLQLTWVHVDVDGDTGAEVDLGLGGAVAGQSASLASLSELRMTGVTSLTLRVMLLLGYSDVAIAGQLERNDTRVRVDLGGDSSRQDVVANVIPGVAFQWKHVGLHLGVGVGAPWLPIAVVPLHVTTVVPDLDFYARF